MWMSLKKGREMKGRGGKKGKYMVAVFVGLLMVVCVVNVFAQPAIPTFPCFIEGNVTINGKEAPVGTEIKAIVGEKEHVYEVKEKGKFSISVEGDMTDEGKIITFFVNGIRADKTLEWRSGATYNIDLAVFTNETPLVEQTPTIPTITPAPSPEPLVEQTPTITPTITPTPSPETVGFEIPPLPASFYGNVTMYGEKAEVGTIVRAYIEGREVGNITVKEKGVYADGFNTYLVVQGTRDDIGKQINFTVNGLEANQTAIYIPGEIRKMDLSAGDSAGEQHVETATEWLIMGILLVVVLVVAFACLRLKVRRRR